MKAVFILFILSICLLHQPVKAQSNHFNDSARILNQLRIKTNKHGMYVLGTWGVANIAEGGIGYFTAGNNQWKYFNEMNAIWGVINAGIAGAGLAGVRKEMNEQLDCSDMLLQYESTKRLYLINAGLDVLYIGTGVFLTEHSKNATSNVDEFRGFGKSLILQGAFLFVFDNVMFASHQRRNSKWYHLVQGVCVTGNGIGFNYNF